MINRTTLRKRMKLWQSFSNRDMKRDVFATLLREDIENGNKIFSIIEKDVKTEKRFRKLLSPGSLNELSDVIIGYNMSTTIEVLLNITEKILMFECAAINKYILLRGKYERYLFATVYKGNIIKNLIMDCQSYTKYRPNETTGGIFVSWRRKEELPTGA